MNQFYKIQLATIISIICIVSILMNVDQAFAFCDAHSEPCFERIKTFDKIDDHFVRNYFFDYADDVFVHYDWPNKSDNVANNFDGFPAIYCFEIISNDEPHFLMANWIDHKSISNIVDMYVPELCEQSINPINSENRPDSLYVNKPMKTLTPKLNVLMLSTPNLHSGDLQSCLLGGFDDKNYGWCNNYKEKIKSQPPLKQFKAGILIEEIECKEDLVKVIKKSNNIPACVQSESKSKLIQRDWIKFQFSFCGADGFDSKGNLNKNNSTHHWDENECNWEYVGPATNSINKWFGNVPENDKWCDTELIVKTKEKIDQDLLKLILLDEIAKFGKAYDMPDRDILLTDMGKNKTKISIEGSWNLEQDRPDIVKALTELIFVDHVEEYHGRLLVVSCQ